MGMPCFDSSPSIHFIHRMQATMIKSHREYLAEIHVKRFKEPPVIPADHERKCEPDQVAQIQCGDSHCKTGYLLSNSCRMKENEAEEEARREEGSALGDDLER